MEQNNNEIFLSIVVPVRNEEENIPELHKRITNVCTEINRPFEVIYVENGSTDKTLEVLKTLSNAKIIVLRWMSYMRKAQSLAMDAGFKAAKGKYIVYMDGDLQVEPEEISKFIEKLDEGYDVVNGWRKKRVEKIGFDIALPLRALLRVAFDICRNFLLKDDLKDPGSAIKAFRREALQNIDLYGEMHRFLVGILKWQGFSIIEIEVRHHPRMHGQSKYDMKKGFVGIADLINVYFWRKYSDRPLHLLGVGGLIVFLTGSVGLFILLVLRALNLMALQNSIFPVLAVLTIIVGLELFVNGIIVDLLARTYYSTGGNKNYLIKEVIEK